MDIYEQHALRDAMLAGAIEENGLRFTTAARRRAIRPVERLIGWQRSDDERSGAYVWGGWAWHGTEAELMECLVARLKESGFRTLREVRLQHSVGRLDAVSWRDDTVVFIEAKLPLLQRQAAPFYRELAGGIGQLLLYREAVESRPDWHIHVNRDVLMYGPAFWRGEAIVRSRWACVIAAPEIPAVAPLLRPIAERSGFEFWCWLPPGELVDLEGQAVDL